MTLRTVRWALTIQEVETEIAALPATESSTLGLGMYSSFPTFGYLWHCIVWAGFVWDLLHPAHGVDAFPASALPSGGVLRDILVHSLGCCVFSSVCTWCRNGNLGLFVLWPWLRLSFPLYYSYRAEFIGKQR